MHGDTLCTDDVEYQKFSTLVRNPQWQRQFSPSCSPNVARSRRKPVAKAASRRPRAAEIMDESGRGGFSEATHGVRR